MVSWCPPPIYEEDYLWTLFVAVAIFYAIFS